MPDGWPDWEKVQDLIAAKNFMAGNEVFNQFKKKALAKDSKEALETQVDHAAIMWEFLVGFAGKKPAYRRHIIQVFNVLMDTPSWVAVWEQQTELHERIKELHEDLQAALAAQSEVLLKSISTKAGTMVAAVKAEEKPENVRVEIAKEDLVNKIQDSSKSPAAGYNEKAFLPEAFSPCSGEGEDLADNPLYALQDGVDEAIAIKGDSFKDQRGQQALSKLRIGCIRCAGREDLFQQESGKSHEVFNFLLCYLDMKPAELNAVAEVMNQLMASSSWAATLEASDLLKDHLQKLPVEAQAALGLQHDKIMLLVSPEAQRHAQGGGRHVEEATQVAEVMQSIRYPSSSSGAPADAPPPPPPTDEWKEARTPEGHYYYYNLKTRQSTWERPESLGGPRVYKVGDEVEIWSNTNKAWGRGKVEKVSGDMVTAEFLLPGGQSAKKELPAKHKDLRPAEGDEWSEDEKVKYRGWFEAVKTKPNLDATHRPGEEIALFLQKSGVKREALVQVWAVANPTASNGDLDFEAFARCCRLVGHCQAIGLDSPLVQNAERPLRVKLRTECLHKRPPAGCPSFDQ
eukprot:TRINITY_DN123137_c0_g1_i1.p1 TRINITY_DN123137_c0_g1~~TRINITY_DN123137_c0_g1_i1.p1  ORF type:complete len:594 (+),score=146.12 TRINITY_DN123137_c0_g1_i1:72-1784(+)